MKATRSAVDRVTHVKVKAGHKILEVGREEVPLACFASRVQVGANLNLLRTSSSISGAKAKNLTLRHPMNNSHVSDPSQAFYAIPTQTLALDRQNDQIEASCERSQYSR
jgi:hypothetical protein